MTDDTHNLANHDDAGVDIDLEGYALGTIDEDGRAEIARQLERDPQLRARLAEVEETVGQLGLGVTMQHPSEGLRDRVLASARQDADGTPAITRITKVSRFWRVAAAVLAVMLVASSFYLYEQVDDRDQQIAALEASLAEARGDVPADGTSSEVVQFTQPLIWHQLDAKNAGDDVRAYLCYTQDGQIGYVILLGMPMKSDDVIQVWLNDDGVRVSAGMFRPDDEGRGFLFFRAPGDSLKAFTSIGLTLEPPGGSDEPTSDPMITGDLHS